MGLVPILEMSGLAGTRSVFRLRRLSVLSSNGDPICAVSNSNKKWRCHRTTFEARSMRTFSGIQPTGQLHLGNYLGAVQPWVQSVQANEDRLSHLFCIVDLHAITMPQNPSELRRNTLEMSASLLGCGLDPEKCVLFLQSGVGSLHTELCWLLTCLSTVQQMGRMTTYKEKSANMKEIPLGLYLYPLLQAADILLYKGTHVPVGEDNLLNVELSRRVAKLFNNRYCKGKENHPIFPIPRAVLVDSTTARVKSLRSPDKKMSKSDPNPRGCVYITDTDDVIVDKVRKSVTDCQSEVTFDPESRPGVSNLVSIHAAVTGATEDEIVRDASSLDTGQYKVRVSEALVEHLRPLRERITYYLDHRDHLDKVFKAGNETATEIAQETMLQARKAVGFIS